MGNPSEFILGERYRLLKPIADGTMSHIFLAEDARRGNECVAVKVLDGGRPDGLGTVVFRRETDSLARLHHPNIVRILGSGEEPEKQWYYIVLEYLPGSLSHDLATRPAGRDDAWSIPLLRQLAEAVAYAHGENVIHRDLKPSNILLTADGVPKITDFGISRLRDRLAHGRTVAHFYSAGYASPEQRAGGLCDERSDVYSLGVLFYQVLSGQSPPGEGPQPALADTLDALPHIRRLIKRMIDPDPARRPGTAIEVVRALRTAEQQSTPPPQCLLVVSRPARAHLIERGADPLDPLAWLGDELGSPDDAALSAMFGPRGGLLLLTESLRLRCERQRRSSQLEVVAAEAPYLPELAAQRERAYVPRIAWRPILFDAAGASLVDRDASRGALDDLYESVRQHMDSQREARELAGHRKDLVQAWEKILGLQEKLLRDSGSPLLYTSVEEGPDTLRFTLKDPAPDDRPWPEETPLAVQSGTEMIQFVGTLRGITDRQIVVSKPQREGAGMAIAGHTIPRTGTIHRYAAEETVALHRQQAALKRLKYGETTNPRLADVLVDLRRAEFDTADRGISFIQPSFEPEKQVAVQSALAARDLFLLQGPPGTGKTTVIAEIVSQIIRAQPSARVLVTSQSNTAVDHALERVAAIHVGEQPEIVRLGREERIGHGGYDWLLEQRRERWREEVVAHCAHVLEDLRVPAADQAPLPIGMPDDLDQIERWIEEARDLLTAMRADEERLTAISPTDPLGDTNSGGADSQMERERDALRAAIAARGAAIADHLATTRDLLALPPDPMPLANPASGIDRLSALLAARREPDTLNPSTHALRTLVAEWMEVFGKTEDFDAPILKRANIVAATCVTAGRRLVHSVPFDWAIVDEAGRATASEILVPLVCAQRAILVGDERQLPPIVDEMLSPEQLEAADISREELETSLFETLVHAAERVRPEMLHMLRTQYRMHPAIGRLVSEVFYEGKLANAAGTEALDHSLPWLDRHIVWLSTSRNRGREESRVGNTFANALEADTILRFLQHAEETYRANDVSRTVGIITGYREQRALLTARLAPTDRNRWQALTIEVATVDAFQGRECDILMYSTVRSNHRRALGFLRDRRRLNVALSRGRRLLVVVGDAEMLRQAEPDRPDNPFRDVLRYMEANPAECRIEYA